MNDVTLVARELRRKNFEEILKLDLDDPAGHQAEIGGVNPVIDVCTACEIQGVTPVRGRPERSLTTTAHGAHTEDFLAATGATANGDWHTQGVLFLFENPGPWWGGYGPYIPGRKQGIQKWYWVHELREWVEQGNQGHLPTYPTGFRPKAYGLLVAALIGTFKLANAYVTNVVKCGTATPKTDPVSLGRYTDECISVCTARHLQEEMEILRPAVVFTFGKVANRVAREAVGRPEVDFIRLAHPASRSLTRQVRREHSLWSVARGLYRARIVNQKQLAETAELFVRH